jgi:hypothetical protein
LPLDVQPAWAASPSSLLLESMTPPFSEFVDGPARGCHYRNSRVTAERSNVGNSSGSNAG